MSNYSGSYLWPPRPESAIPKGMVKFYEQQKWIAQIKKNGTCSVIFVNNNEVRFMNRHKEDHKAWQPLKENYETFHNISNGWSVFIGELLHNKVSGGPRNKLYLFDVLVSNGVDLVGKTWLDRQEILFQTFNPTIEVEHEYVIDENTGIARSFTKDFKALYEGINSAEDEGLVFKNPNAKLEHCGKQSSNSSWQAKCRKQTKNYSF